MTILQVISTTTHLRLRWCFMGLFCRCPYNVVYIFYSFSIPDRTCLMAQTPLHQLAAKMADYYVDADSVAQVVEYKETMH